MSCQKEGTFLCSECKGKLIWIQPTCFVCRKWVPGSFKVTAGPAPNLDSRVSFLRQEENIRNVSSVASRQFNRGGARNSPNFGDGAGRTCSNCRKKSLIYAFFSPFLYSDPVIKNLIHGLKYERLKSLANLLGELLTEYMARFKISFPDEAILIPIPLFRDRFRIRGFNQSELVVRYLSDRLGMKSETKILKKIRKTKPQIELSAEGRRLNLKDAFSVFNPETVKGKIIILVDDVKTTGSTLEEAAIVLRKAGAGKILVLTVAH